MLDPLIGEHHVLQKIRLRLPVLAQSYEPLLIVGEHGTGKSLVAAHIHAQSPFASNKRITIDCSLLEHRDQRISLFGGELEELSSTRRSAFEIQTTVVIKHPQLLIPYLQEQIAESFLSGEVKRSRSGKRFPLQSRIVFFLERKHELTGKLSPRLSDCLNSYQRIHLPPLRSHRQDIPLLARHFAQQQSRVQVAGFRKSGEPGASLLRLLLQHTWRGNIAELKAFIQTLAGSSPEQILFEQEVMQLRRLMTMIHERKPFSIRNNLRAIHSLLVTRALDETGGNRLQAARLLGLTEGALR